ncbi:hypothetical protein ALP39_200311 [Pseudomonas marginalis pv. marginalis]|nr:hypothetical protein ALP39_200311 [Pseudomonas marginalis pv. marginalis]
MKKVALITGVTGFIGGELARRLLKDNWRVAIVVRSNSDLSTVADIHGVVGTHVYDGTTESLFEIMRTVKPDVVFHLASLFLIDHVPEQVSALINSNVTFGVQVLEAMAACGVTNIVNAGTSWQNYHSDEYCAVNLYAATKQAFEDILNFYVDKYKMRSVTLKLFDTYGPSDKRRKLISLIVDTLKQSGEIGMSPGDQVIDISHVDDVVEHFVRAGLYCMESELAKSEVYFVSGERYTVKELVRAVQLLIESNATITYGGRPYRDREVMRLPTVECKTPPWNDEFRKRTLKEGVFSLLNGQV